MVFNQVQELIPLIAGNLLVILASSFFGSVFILLGRSIRQQRALIGALHAELVDNYVEAVTLKEGLESQSEDEDTLGSLTTFQIRSSAYESLQTNEPSLYASIDSYSEKLYKPYVAHPQFEEYEKMGFWKTMLDMISITSEPVPDGGETIDPDPLKKFLESYEEWTLDAIQDVEAYTEETLLRRVIYYNCLSNWPMEESE